MKVYLYVENLGDGSTAIRFLDREITEKDVWEERDYWLDGDGLAYKSVLNFESREVAEAAGIEFYKFEE